ncbi:ER degradation-enhancing alpha-mannosidase-like protein 1 [Homalodisca vitripennis]|nr:ER degradation-enhancing alpha-mannosidase-like protein 1 [Homalodisca vitripennis]
MAGSRCLRDSEIDRVFDNEMDDEGDGFSDDESSMNSDVFSDEEIHHSNQEHSDTDDSPRAQALFRTATHVQPLPRASGTATRVPPVWSRQINYIEPNIFSDDSGVTHFLPPCASELEHFSLLVSNSIDVLSGKWIGRLSGLGAGLDSYYEYLLKSYIMFGETEDYFMFSDIYKSIYEHMRQGNKKLNKALKEAAASEEAELTRPETFSAMSPNVSTTDNTSLEVLENILTNTSLLATNQSAEEKLEMAAKVGKALLEENSHLKEKILRL